MKTPYIKTQLSTIVNISKIVTIHYYEFDKNFVFNGEKHPFWELVYVDKGQVEVCRDDEKITLSQGEIVFHKPNEFHSIKALNSAPNFFVISFVCSSNAMVYFEKFNTTLDKNLKPFLSSIIEEAETTFEIPKNSLKLKKLTKKVSASIGGEQLIKTYLEQLLIFLIRNINDEKSSPVFVNRESMENYLLSAMKKYIEEKNREVFRVGDLCEEIGYSKSYLCRLFSEQTGETIAAYAMKSKIKLARRMIREGNMNFAEISDELKFDNPQYFSRVFKRVTGMTPTEFKSTLRIKD